MKPATLLCLILLTMPAGAHAQKPAAGTAVTTLSFSAYAAGLHVADIRVALNLDPAAYRVDLTYHTTGVTGVFVRGNQFDSVSGRWDGAAPRPNRFTVTGRWRGEDRVARIDYDNGTPRVRELKPPNAGEREPVPDILQVNTVDGLSAMAQLIRTVERTGRCDGSARTYDGRRLITIDAATVGDEMVPQTDRSVFAGRALRCDFTGRLVAGFRLDDSHDNQSKPLRGSAWLAPLANGGPPMPVRLTFETRWVGDMTVYLTAVTDSEVADATPARPVSRP